MAYYVKVTKQVANSILKDGVSPTMTKDGNCLLFQSEVNGVKGINLSERCEYLGGALVQEMDALGEINGTAPTSAHCYTPVEFGGDGDDAQDVDAMYNETGNSLNDKEELNNE